MSAPTAVISWLRYTANDLGMELDEHDNASILAVLHEIDRRLNAACDGGRRATRNAIAFGIMASSAWGPAAGHTNLLDDLTDQYMAQSPVAPYIDDYTGGVE